MKLNTKKNIIIAVLVLFLVGACAYIGIDIFGGEDTAEFGYEWLEKNFVAPLLAGLGGGTTASMIVGFIFSAMTNKLKEASDKTDASANSVGETAKAFGDLSKEALRVMAEFNNSNEIKLDAFTGIVKILDRQKDAMQKYIQYERERIKSDLTLQQDRKKELEKVLNSLDEFIADTTLEEAWKTINRIKGENENEKETDAG